DEVFGDKVCAGGLTRKGLTILDVPDDVIEHKIQNTAVFSKNRKSQTNAPMPFVFTLKRKDLGAWQAGLLENTSVEVRKNAKVTGIEDGKVIINKAEEIEYQYLVGADGYASIVRKHLKIPMEKSLIGIQYMVPDPVENPQLEVHLHSKYFKSWYAWSFPHEKSIAVGCVCDPTLMSSKKLKENFHRWLDDKGIDISNAEYQSAPIAYDYRGIQFGDVYLAGEAAGLASGLTGEGIYQCLVSGEEVARRILGEQDESEEFRAVLKYNSIQEKIMKFSCRAGPFRGMIHALIVILLNNKRMKAKIRNSFS
ncbi:MAG: NAD(P)/FAD-dependent oxidoreductase, partial [Bacteroidota bacterium]|nr:NAD(P)/FAD-dependent oxidoreductase [Bacteroidota bacterium]